LGCRVGRVWVCCVVDLLLFLSGVCLIGGCGLRETHAGLLQAVSDPSTVAPFFLWLCVVIWVVICVIRCCCVCVLHCCFAIVGVGIAECGLGCCWCVTFCLILSCF